ETAVHVKCHVSRIGGGARESSLSADSREHQLELVEETRIQRDVLRPDIVLMITRQEVAEPEVRADSAVDVAAVHLKKTERMIVASQSLGEVGADAIPVERRADLVAKRHHDGECRF